MKSLSSNPAQLQAQIDTYPGAASTPNSSIIVKPRLGPGSGGKGSSKKDKAMQESKGEKGVGRSSEWGRGGACESVWDEKS